MLSDDIKVTIENLWQSIESHPESEEYKRELIDALANLLKVYMNIKLSKPADLPDGTENVIKIDSHRQSFDLCKRLSKQRWASRSCGTNYKAKYSDQVSNLRYVLNEQKVPQNEPSDDSDSSLGGPDNNTAFSNDDEELQLIEPFIRNRTLN